MSLLSRILVPVVGIAALVAVQGCTAATPTSTPSAVKEEQQEYIRVTERTSGDGYKPKGNFVFRAGGIRYYEVRFAQQGVKGALIVMPQFNAVALSIERGASDSAPFSAVSGCDAAVRSWQDSPRSLIRPEHNPARAARINGFLTGLYAAAGISPADCTITPR